MIELDDGDKIFLDYIKNSPPVTEKEFERFWEENGEMIQKLGYDKKSYRHAVNNVRPKDTRCENCTLFKEDKCDIIEKFFEENRKISLCWIYYGNNCSGFVKDEGRYRDK